MRPLPALFGLTILIALTAHASATADQNLSQPQFDAVGTLSTGIFTIGGETTGVTLRTDHGTYELLLFGELDRAAQALNGCKVHVRGTLTTVRGIETKDRQVVAVSSLAPADPPSLMPVVNG